MADNQWEVVTKSKKQKNLEMKIEVSSEKKRLEAMAPKLNEILSAKQYALIMSGQIAAQHSPSKSTSSSNKSKSPTNNKKAKRGAAAVNKKQQEQKPANNNKKQQQVKSAPPKRAHTLQENLRNITAEEFETSLTELKALFPSSELLWLRGTANFFNRKLGFDFDPIYAGKSTNYPSALMPKALKDVVVQFLETVGADNLVFFYDYLLKNMAIDLSKSLTVSAVAGYKLMLQLIATRWPEICSANMQKADVLRISYENRSNICLSLLWAIGQCGYQQLTEGIKVWHKVMLPTLEMRSYTKFVTEYLERILNNAVNKKVNLNQNEFFAIYNDMKKSYNVSQEYQECLNRCAALFLQKYIASATKHANIFLTLLRVIENPEQQRSEIESCYSCLVHDSSEDSYKIWKMNYKKNVYASLLLFKKIDKEMRANKKLVLSKSEAFDQFLQDVQVLNAELGASKRKVPHLNELLNVVANVVQNKKRQAAEQQPKKKCGCCKWLLLSIITLVLIGVTINYDVQTNGKGVFANSATGKQLKKAGLLPHVERGWYATMSTSARGYKWAEKNVPPYSKPICQLLCDVTKVVRNAVVNIFTTLLQFTNAKLPVAAEYLEQYIPGLPKKISDFSTTARTAGADLYEKAVTFARTQVLVGRFSPDNLNAALNTTRNAAIDYLNLFHKKVDLYAKMK